MSDTGAKPTNPKDQIGSDKIPIHLWPETATITGCLGFLNGLLKYGRSNWRPGGVRCSIYIAAARRHINAWFEGQEFDPDDGVPHLSGALASLAIIVDARAAGVLEDDRQYPGGYHKLIEELTPHVRRLKELHAGKSPKHWTIQDAMMVLRPEALEPIKIMSDPIKIVNVAVGVIVRESDQHVFLQRRSLGDENFPGRWECPGGGISPGETPEAALQRELREELDVGSTVHKKLWGGSVEGYKGMRHNFFFYAVTIHGEPRAVDRQPEIGWFTLEQMQTMALTPANLWAGPSIEEHVRGEP